MPGAGEAAGLLCAHGAAEMGTLIVDKPNLAGGLAIHLDVTRTSKGCPIRGQVAEGNSGKRRLDLWPSLRNFPSGRSGGSPPGFTATASVRQDGRRACNEIGQSASTLVVQ